MPTDDERDEERDDSGIIGFALLQMQNQRVYEEALSEGQRAYMDGIVAVMMEFASAERGYLPHHGAVGLIAWLARNNLVTDPALMTAMAFIGALEKWEREHAGT